MRRMQLRLPRLVASTGLVLALGIGCSSSSSDEEVSFPKGFLWGTATAAFQVEKGDAHTDWAAWVATDGKIKNGDSPDRGGPDAFAHVDDDIRLMKDHGLGAYRLSIEWGRLYPTRAAFDADTPDPDAVSAYDTLLGKLHAAGIVPMVTLHHFAFPDWLDDVTKPKEPQGWERPETVDLFVEFAKRTAARWGDKVDLWITINEPLVTIVTGYIQGGSPPGVLLDPGRAFAVAKTMVRAHAKAFDAIHAADTKDADGDGASALVSIAKHQRTFHPYDPTDPDDVAATDHVHYLWNLWFWNAIVHGDWDDDIDGSLDGPNDRRADPTLRGRADFLGINYYSDTLISAHRGIVIPIVKASVSQDHLPTDRPKTDVAWDIYPEGFQTVLLEAKPFALPVYVTENGLADRDDKNRARFLSEHLLRVGRAIAAGVDVRGYFHWSLIDNFEWQSGFCPKFGFASVDPQTGARSPRASFETYARIAKSGRLRQSEIDPLPAYVTGDFCN